MLAAIILRLLVILWPLLAIPVFLIRAQPYDDTQLRTLFLPEDCPTPCFLGIRPGVTTTVEAIRLLREHPWVIPASVTRRSRFNVVRIEWYWNGSQPDFLRRASNGIAVATILPGFNTDPTLTADTRVITGVLVFTTVRYGEARLLLGEGSNRANYIVSRKFINAEISAVYPQRKMALISQGMDCPVRVADFWNEPVLIEIGYTFVDDRMHICKGLR